MKSVPTEGDFGGKKVPSTRQQKDKLREPRQSGGEKDLLVLDCPVLKDEGANLTSSRRVGGSMAGGLMVYGGDFILMGHTRGF